MTETEKRRVELLSQARNLYREQQSIPAVHPRYGAAYQKLYGSGEKEKTSTLGVRAFLALMLFVLFAGMDYGEIQIMEYQSDEIVEVLSQNVTVLKDTISIEETGDLLEDATSIEETDNLLEEMNVENLQETW